MGGAATKAAISTASEDEKVAALQALYEHDEGAFDRLVTEAKKAKHEPPQSQSQSPEEAETLSAKGGTAFQEAVLHEHNLARQNPIEYVTSRVLPLLSRYHGRELHEDSRIVLTREGPKAVDDLVEALRRHAPCGPLTLERGLVRAATRHARDLGKRGAAGHDGADGSDVQARIEAEGEWWGIVAENVSLGWKLAKDVVLNLLVDDGVESRGHRLNVLDPRATCLGVSDLADHRSDLAHCVVANYTGGFGPPKTILLEPRRTEATGRVTADVRAILESLPRGLDDIKAQITRVLEDSHATKVVLDYKPKSLQVKFVTTSTTGTTTKTQTASWSVATE